MPMKDITREPRLARIGVIRLGVKRRTDKGKEYPSETPHFVLADAPEIAEAYGQTPTELLVYLPFRAVDQNYIGFHELWTSLACLCRGDGEIIGELLDPADNMTPVIRSGEVIRAYTEQDGQHYEPSAEVPCPGLDHDLYPRCAECKPNSLLLLMIRDPRRPTQLVRDRMGYYQIRSTSYHNARNIPGQLQHIYELMASMGRDDLRGIPLILKREPTQITYVGVDRETRQPARKTSTHYLLSFEVDPAWIRSANERLHQLALDHSGSAPRLPDVIDRETGEIVEGQSVEIVTGVTEEPHWIDDQATAAGYWAFLRKAGLTTAEALEALGVSDLHDYTGTREDAREVLEARVALKAIEAGEPHQESLL